MNSFLIVSSEAEKLKTEIQNRLKNEFKVGLDHPDVLFLDQGTKLGMNETKKIREHLSFKPFSSRIKAVVLIGAEALTPEAQNSLLKTLEEPAEQAYLFLGTDDASKLIETLRSRCQIIELDSGQREENSLDLAEIRGLLEQDIDEKYKYIENADNKEEVLDKLIFYYRNELGQNPENIKILKEMINAKQWIRQNVNPRGVLEYVMLLTEKSSR